MDKSKYTAYAILRIDYEGLSPEDHDEIGANIEAAIDLCDDYGKWTQDMSEDAACLTSVKVIGYDPQGLAEALRLVAESGPIANADPNTHSIVRAILAKINLNN